MIKCEQVEIYQFVKVRKHSVDIKSLQTMLRAHKCMSNKGISIALGIPLTMVEHWFRTDKYFSIPEDKLWFKLKDLLNINNNEFDKFVTEFEYKPNVFDMSNRAYIESGLAPTLLTDASINVVVYE